MHLVPIALRFNSGSNRHIVTPKIPKIPSLFRFPTLIDDVIGMTSSFKNDDGEGIFFLKNHSDIIPTTSLRDHFTTYTKGLSHFKPPKKIPNMSHIALSQSAYKISDIVILLVLPLLLVFWIMPVKR